MNANEAALHWQKILHKPVVRAPAWWEPLYAIADSNIRHLVDRYVGGDPPYVFSEHLAWKDRCIEHNQLLPTADFKGAK